MPILSFPKPRDIEYDFCAEYAQYPSGLNCGDRLESGELLDGRGTLHRWEGVAVVVYIKIDGWLGRKESVYFKVYPPIQTA
jgi:hypothetical protein